MKPKKAKLFVQTFGKTLLSARNLHTMEDVLPPEEALRVHLLMERLKILKDKDYKPQPLMLKVAPEKFDSIVAEIKGKDTFYQSDAIYLIVQSGSLPVCVINK